MKLKSVIEKAKELGISRISIARKCRQGKIKAQKVGRAWVIIEN